MKKKWNACSRQHAADVFPPLVCFFFFFRFASIRCPAKLCCLTKSVSKFCCLYLFSMVCGCLDIWITRFIWYTCGGVCGTWRLTKTSFSLSFSFSRGWCRVIMFLFVLDISVSFHIFCIDSCQLIALLVFLSSIFFCSGIDCGCNLFCFQVYQVCTVPPFFSHSQSGYA